MIAPYSTIYQILHSRPDNTVTQFEVIQFEATFDRNINVDQRQMPANSKHLLQIQAVGFQLAYPFPPAAGGSQQPTC